MRKAVVVTYRAVHEKTPWRRVRGHTSIENALIGHSDGAPGLFAHRVRIDYAKHGEPLYAVIWEDGAVEGFVVKKDIAAPDGTVSVKVSVDILVGYDMKGGASLAELERHFSSVEMPASEASGNDRHDALATVVEAKEGELSLEQHLVRERSRALADAKKAAVLCATGRLACEACGLEFFVAYGAIAEGFCEIHHNEPLASRSSNVTTDLDGLAVLCSNCHSVIHKTQPMWSVAELTAHLIAHRPSV